MSFDIVQVLNIGVCSVSRSWLMENLTKGIVFTPNVDHFVRLQKDRLFYRAYKNADFILMDSQVVFFLLNMRQKKIIEKISGVDFFPDFCRYHIHNREMKFFFLGGLGQFAIGRHAFRASAGHAGNKKRQTTRKT